MFRKMRRFKQELTAAECEKMLSEVSYGVLAVSGDGGYPYAVPLNFVYDSGAVYFHCAKEGHKLDAIKSSDKVSFCIVGKSAVAPKEFATDYYSVIVFGRAEIIESDSGKIAALRLLNKKLAPGFPKEGELEIQKDLKNVCIVKIKIEDMTGKAAIEGIRDTVNRT